ncbi:hypothetical protein IVA77_08930 [Bradyrhizobium sp. 136]|nr:hypothetical protein [Bradyrhizobium sp. 163]MCK1761722.1 hypothetical protein [Bradyrhizobium sp. 136]
MRHEYRDVDPELIWSITLENLPSLVQAAHKLLTRLREPLPA